jgi:hypothetical protein
LYLIPFRVISPDAILIFSAIVFSNVVFPDPANKNPRIKFSVTCGRSVVFSGYFVFNYDKTNDHDITENILESGVKNHDHKPLFKKKWNDCPKHPNIR